MIDEPVIATSTIAWAAFVLAALFGAVGNKTSFCTMGAVSDIVNMGDWNRMRMWALAIAVGIIGTAGLQLAGLFDVSDSIYASSRLIWLSNLVGGVLFGIGMTLASGCGSKTLIRIGGGNLKSLIVLVFLAISAYMTMRGLFAIWRTRFLDSVSGDLASGQDLPSMLAQSGMAHDHAILLAAGLFGGGLLLFALARREAWQADILLGGLVIGAITVAAWYLTAHVGYVEEHPETLERAFIGTNSGMAESFSFVAPVAYTLELLLFWSDTSRIVTFGIAGTLGMIAGSLVYALATGSFRLESFTDTADLLRHIVGAILMGFGGVTAFGCTVGQGLSGFSTLALGSILTTLAIIAGCVVTLKIQYWLMMRDG